MSDCDIIWCNVVQEAHSIDHHTDHMSFQTKKTPGYRWKLSDKAMDALMDGYQVGVMQGIFDASSCGWVNVSEMLLQDADANVTMQDYLDMRHQYPRLCMTFMWAMIHPCLYALYSYEAQLEILKACANYPPSAAVCKYLFGNTVPREIQTAIDEKYDQEFYSLLPISNVCEKKHQRNWLASYDVE